MGQSPCTIVHGLWPNFIENVKERILHFDYIFSCIYMYLCCVESLSWFRSKLDFLQIFKVSSKLCQSPCTIVHGLWPNFIENVKERILHFDYIFSCIYMYLCCVESLSWFLSKLDFLQIFKVAPKSGQSPCTIVQGPWPILAKMARREFSILLHFLIHIHVLMLHRSFELIPIKLFRIANYLIYIYNYTHIIQCTK